MIDNEVLKKYNINPISYKKINKVILVTTKDNKYIFKKSNEDLSKIYKYLESRNFNYYPKYYHLDNYDITSYIEDLSISKEEKSLDLINLISLLHTKTTYYKDIDKKEIDLLYEDIDNKLNNLLEYYLYLNNYIDNEIFMSPSRYLFVRNISKIYSLINYLKNELDDWYSLIKISDRKRVVFIHNNLSLDHLIRNNNSYLINWNKAKFDVPIYDLYNLYKNNYKDLNFSILLEEYEKRYPLKDEEKKLLFILISIPSKIEFTNNEYNNTLKVQELLDYVYETDKIISKYYPNQNKNEDNNFYE